jgi:hypothetical protein
VYAVYVHTVEGQVQINGASRNHDGVARCAEACRVSPPVTPVLGQQQQSTPNTVTLSFPLLPVRLVVPIARVCPAGVLVTAGGGLGGGILGWIARRLSRVTAVLNNADRTKRYSARLV